MIKINRLCYYSNSFCQKKRKINPLWTNLTHNKNTFTECAFAWLFFILVCLFKVFSSHSRKFHSFGDVTIAGEGLKIMIYTRHLWPLSSEGSLACHTHCYTGHPFIMVILEDAWHSHLLPSVWQGAVNTCFNDLSLSRLGQFNYVFCNTCYCQCLNQLYLFLLDVKKWNYWWFLVAS